VDFHKIWGIGTVCTREGFWLYFRSDAEQFYHMIFMAFISSLLISRCESKVWKAVMTPCGEI